MYLVEPKCRRYRGMLSIGLVLLCVKPGFAATLPPSPEFHAGAANCAEVRAGAITWSTSRDRSMAQSSAQQDAIAETLTELVKQLTGIEVKSLTRTNVHLENEHLDDQMQVASFAKVRGRVLDYEVLNIRKTFEGQLALFEIELEGRVCADEYVDGPTVVALGITQKISARLLNSVESELSRNFAVYPQLILANEVSSKVYSDLEIDIEVGRARTRVVNRSDAIAAIRASLGNQAARNLSQYITRVELRVTMSANVHEDGSKIVSTQVTERELSGRRQPSPELIAELEVEAVKQATKDLSAQLARHIQPKDAY